MTLAELFDIAEDLELRHAKLYAHFSLVFGEWDERLAKFWEQMSTEEWQHYITLNFCRSLWRAAEDLRREAPAINELALRETQQLLDAGEQHIQQGELELQAAFELAITLEQGETDAIYETLIDVTHRAVKILDRPYLRQRIQRAEKQAHEHADRLIQAIRKFADSPALVRQAQQTLQS